MGNSAAYDDLARRLDGLYQEKQSLETIIETIEDGFIETDLRGNIRRFNQAFCDISGYPPEEADGLSYRAYMGEAAARNVYQTFNKVFRTGIAIKAFDHEVIRKDGGHRIVEISITPLKNDAGYTSGFRCIMRDVTARKQAEEELLNQRSRLEAIFRSVEEGIVTVDGEFNVTDVNDAAAKICDLLPEKLPDFFACPDSANCSLACRDVLEETLDKRKVIRDYPVRCGRQANPLQKVNLSCAPLEDHHGNFLGAVLVIRDITRLTDLERELKERHQFHRLIGKSHQMQEIYRLVEDISDYEATVLISGESGTGKELVARAIHDTGSRRFKPFVTVNCSALAEPLLESELFGHVRGAFTGAIRDHMGRFEAADGGTLLLDEIGDISPLIQLKLLRVLQEKAFERVGASSSIHVDVRVIACTHQDLKEKVRRGEFREDLYYRLNVLEIQVPALRRRIDDLPLLMEHFIARFEKQFGMRIESVSDDVMDAFMKYDWPGNVRELEHCIERAVILSRGAAITAAHLPPAIAESKKNSGRQTPLQKEAEAQHIQKVLFDTDWNKAKAARLLGISRKTLYQKIRKYGISGDRNQTL